MNTNLNKIRNKNYFTFSFLRQIQIWFSFIASFTNDIAGNCQDFVNIGLGIRVSLVVGCICQYLSWQNRANINTNFRFYLQIWIWIGHKIVTNSHHNTIKLGRGLLPSALSAKQSREGAAQNTSPGAIQEISLLSPSHSSLYCTPHFISLITPSHQTCSMSLSLHHPNFKLKNVTPKSALILAIPNLRQSSVSNKTQ